MAVNFEVIGRTARIIKPYSAEQRQGRNGAFESKMVMFSLATDRDYKSTVDHEDGSQTKENLTDFYAVRCTGKNADLFQQYCSATKKDEQGNDKLVSRRLQIKGHLETYQADRTVQANCGGQLYKFDVKETRNILVAERIYFLDANPVANNNNTEAAQAVPVQASPVQANVQVAQVAPAPTVPVANTEGMPFA